MKQALSSLGDVIPKNYLVTDENSLHHAIAEIGFPGVLKPSGASGSKGIFAFNTVEEAKLAFNKLQMITKPENDAIFRHFGSELIYEEFITGPEFSVEGWISNGVITIVGITDKWTTDNYHLEYQHIHPSALPISVQAIIKEKTLLILKKLELDDCAFHLEAKWTEKGFRFIEVAARTAGGYIASHLVQMSHKIDFCEQILRVVTGQPTITEIASISQYAGIHFFQAKSEGKFAGITSFESLPNNKKLAHVFLETPIGSSILLPPRHFGLQRVGAVTTKAATYDEVLNTLLKVETKHNVIIE
jgi:biotin carboxylase